MVTTDISVTPSRSSASATLSTAKPSCTTAPSPVDDRAHHDRQPGHVVERQAAEPPVGRVHAHLEGGADRAPQVVSVGQPDRTWMPGRAAGQDATVDGVEIVLAEQGQVGLGPARVAGLRDGKHRPGARECGLSLGGRQPGVQRLGDRAKLHQRVEQDHVVGPHRELQGHRRAAPDAVRGEPAGGRGRFRLELLIGEAAAFGDQRRAIGAGLRPLGQPVVEEHRQG